MPSFRPSNLFVLMSDQHNRLMTGCAGHPDVKTPNVDALAAVEAVGGAEAIVAGGVKFTHSPPLAQFVHRPTGAASAGRY